MLAGIEIELQEALKRKEASWFITRRLVSVSTNLFLEKQIGIKRSRYIPFHPACRTSRNQAESEAIWPVASPLGLGWR